MILLQGFDEFMNLVIDDAVEVKQATKTDPEEKRRELGKILSFSRVSYQDFNKCYRSDPTQGG